MIETTLIFIFYAAVLTVGILILDDILHRFRN